MQNIEIQVGISLTVYFWFFFFIIIFLCRYRKYGNKLTVMIFVFFALIYFYLQKMCTQKKKYRIMEHLSCHCPGDGPTMMI